MRNKIKINDIFAYIIGNYRMYFYYGGWWSKRFALISWLRKRVLRTHIKEQIAWRLSVMNKECYSSGSCIKCGCDTPALQMANKACKGGCYFEMFNRETWFNFKLRVLLRKGAERAVKPSLEYTRMDWQQYLESFPISQEEGKEYVWPVIGNNPLTPKEAFYPDKDNWPWDSKVEERPEYIIGHDPYKEDEENQGPYYCKRLL